MRARRPQQPKTKRLHGNSQQLHLISWSRRMRWSGCDRGERRCFCRINIFFRRFVVTCMPLLILIPFGTLRKGRRQRKRPTTVIIHIGKLSEFILSDLHCNERRALANRENFVSRPKELYADRKMALKHPAPYQWHWVSAHQMKTYK